MKTTAAVCLALAALFGCRRQPPAPGTAAASPSPAQASAPASVPSAPAARLTGKPLYSQHAEELIIRDFFQDRRGGVFLDVGCASPISNSNTYYLEKHLGWTGIAVDALPDYGPAWERKRPGSKFANYLVSDHSDTVESFYRSQMKGISSVRKDQKGPGGKEIALEEIKVPTTTLDRLLEKHGVSKLDLLSMDIEGAEVTALAGFDIARFRPQLVVIEAKPDNRAKIQEYFARHGYERLERYLQYDEVNYYYAPRRPPRLP